MNERERELMEEAESADRRDRGGIPHVEDLHFHAGPDGSYTVAESEADDKTSTLSDDDGAWHVVSRWSW